ncbi:MULTISPECIES: N-acetylmuramoyl-L-alanine amidase [Brevibacillus]|nr:N-acetylmuramoyl-L-alanine amidase [Brevibacillus borstelensis]MBE5395805.1 N-acetylmuramoyl-L-alanine amidase [Brevibacillus borstelensis]MCC0565787.1 N-acetylmuramoyl-L-alanine amidase family protein [Brevibacillus borstelensis]MCM3560391.1 N-acetylmuramoyl-L-alanine amidase family protein [Brevibacillus borstelensis]MCM3625566.1 N-acetylmuramoyl-L-alanine amidase family protein [Brevibacillus borstelensis]MED1746852.1 N-acetylmuramoyl-L-alanine amidase [Brevibacillus borstelensis]
MKTRLLPLFVLLFLLIIPGWASAAGSSAAPSVHLMIGGQAVQPDVPPIIEKGRTLVPVRVIAEGLGAKVDWNQATRTAVITRGPQTLQLTVGSKNALVNGKKVQLDTPPVMRNQRMLLPLRFVGESLGVTVGWDNASRTVIANETPEMRYNGNKPTLSLKGFQYGDKLYISAQAAAEQVGKKGQVWKHPDRGLTIDGELALPLEELEAELGGRFTWDQGKNRVEIERLAYFTGVTHDDEVVRIETSLPVTANAFVLQGPHRIVLDLPQTELDQDLLDKLKKSSNSDDYEGGETSVDDEDQDADADEKKKGSDQDDDDKENRHTDASRESDEADDQSAAAEHEDEEKSKKDTLVQDVRYSQYSASPQTVRVVIELNQKSKYNLEYTEDGIEVKLSPVPKKTGFLIVVDAGHGGKDQGAKGVNGNIEKDFTLAVANKLVQLLKQYPEFQVEATRSTDVYLTLDERVVFANERHADLFLSVHANSFTKPTTGGTETFYYNANSKNLAEVVHRHLQGATQFPNRGVKQTGFYVIKHTTMPAVLTETGFLSNPGENAKLTSPAFQQKVAEALAAAIREYYQSYH